MYASQLQNQNILEKSNKIGFVDKIIGIGKASNKKRCCYCQSCQNLADKIPARLVLYFLSWTGFLVSFMMRNDINFALVAMTNPTKSANATNDTSSVSTMRTYDWSSTVKSMIISSFYWCYVLSQIVGGIATQYFGTKKVFGWSQFIKAACSLCMPWAADFHYGLIIALRSMQGIASGVTWPAMYAVAGYWIPFEERSRFMSSFQGFSIGIGLTYPICGFIIEQFGWRYVFLTTGSLGMCWCIAWYFLGFNTPQQHPRITAKELQYIEERIDKTSLDSSSENAKNVPWCSIFKSLPAWAIGITTFGRIWIHYIFIVSGPNFMKNILNFNYQQNGFLSGMPFICSYFSSLIFCYIADKMATNHVMNLTNIRKLFTAISQVVPGILLFSISYLTNIAAILILWFIAITFISASYAGAMANIVDISPNYAGPVLAFCQTIHMTASFLSPIAAGLIVRDETSIKQWRTVFILGAAVAIVTYVFYQFLGSAEIQKWNRSNAGNFSEEQQTNKLKT